MRFIYVVLFFCFPSFFYVHSNEDYNYGALYPLSTYKKFTVVIPSFNNEKFVDKNITSVLMQNYPNFRVVYINDASSDKTLFILKKSIERLGAKNVIIVDNQRNLGAVANLYNAISQLDDDEIVCVLDGDDWFAHNKVLQKLNLYYQNPDVWLTYGQYQSYPSKKRGHCEAVPKSWLRNRLMREKEWTSSHLRTFYAKLFKLIDVNDLKINNKYFHVTYDLAIMFPMLDMAGEHSIFIDEILYIYNRLTPLNDDKLRAQEQFEVGEYIRKLKKYELLETLF